jgi:aryl-alcohol dehydrogenase-like predicted oxidoreductase
MSGGTASRRRDDRGVRIMPLMRRIGGRPAFPLAFGPMRLSYAGRPPEPVARQIIRRSLDAGVTMLDTANVYCESSGTTGHNERLIRAALAEWDGDRDGVLVATKGGHVRAADGSISRDGTPSGIRRACEASLVALGVDRIGLYYHHSPDPRVPIEESLGVIKELREEGKIDRVAVSNYTVDQIQRARTILELTAVQNRYSFHDRGSEPVVALCSELGLAFVAWGVLGRSSTAIPVDSGIAQVGRARGVSPQRVALAWTLARSDCVIPIVGARTWTNVADCLAAVELDLTQSELLLIKATDSGREALCN